MSGKRASIDDVDEIRKVYKELKSVEKTAHKTGWSRVTVHKYVRDLSSNHPSSLYKKNPVIQMDINKNILNEFSTPSEASEKTGIAFDNITHCLKKRTKTAGGYIFEYKKVN